MRWPGTPPPRAHARSAYDSRTLPVHASTSYGRRACSSSNDSRHQYLSASGVRFELGRSRSTRCLLSSVAGHQLFESPSGNLNTVHFFHLGPSQTHCLFPATSTASLVQRSAPPTRSSAPLTIKRISLNCPITASRHEPPQQSPSSPARVFRGRPAGSAPQPRVPLQYLPPPQRKGLLSSRLAGWVLLSASAATALTVDHGVLRLTDIARSLPSVSFSVAVPSRPASRPVTDGDPGKRLDRKNVRPSS